jgi:hypothetical protein
MLFALIALEYEHSKYSGFEMKIKYACLPLHAFQNKC